MSDAPDKTGPSPDIPLYSHVKKVAVTGLVVGTLICLINGSFHSGTLLEIILNYFLPIAVSSWARFSLIRELTSQQATNRVDAT